jgi:hypothetical protein
MKMELAVKKGEDLSFSVKKGEDLSFSLGLWPRAVLQLKINSKMVWKIIILTEM